MKSLLFIALAALSINAFAKDRVILQCTTPGDALSDVQIVINNQGDQQVKVIGMDGRSEKFLVMMPNLYNAKSSSQTIAAAKFPDSATAGEIDQAVMLQVSANKKNARLAHKGSVFYLDCR